MHDYEIRVFSPGRGQASIEARHVNDHAAIRAAQKMAHGKRFEVWRGSHCIYHPPRLHAADQQTRPAS